MVTPGGEKRGRKGLLQQKVPKAVKGRAEDEKREKKSRERGRDSPREPHRNSEDLRRRDSGKNPGDKASSLKENDYSA